MSAKEQNEWIENNWVKPTKEKIRKQEEEKKLQEQKKKEESQWINLICTFYSSGEDENGIGNSNKTASGKRLSRGMCASNSHKLGTQIYTKEFNVLTVTDRGNEKYIHKVDENTYRIDIYVPDKNLAEKMGVMKIKGKIIIKEETNGGSILLCSKCSWRCFNV
jgi:3D (Asp-Asp-Asp) domain-containing protein